MGSFPSFSAYGWFVPYLILALFPYSVPAGTFLEPNAAPVGISPACLTALTADTACREAVAALVPSEYYPLTKLQSICNPACVASLASYHNAVVSNCAQDTWEDEGGNNHPVAMFSELIRYSYDLACLTEGGRFCNNVAAAFAAAADPDAAEHPGGVPAGGDFGDHDTSDPCDTCLLANLRFQAGSPYYDGPKLQSLSMYESRTSSCGVANMPLTTTTNSLITPTTVVPTPTPTCAGTTYTIQPGDNCHSISLSQGIGTEWLILENDLAAFCHDFPTEGELCLVNTCTVHTVLESDTCKSIAKANGITEAQLRAWNPSINAGCYNLNQMVGDQLCVAKPGTPYITPGPTTLAPSIPITAAPMPTNVASGTNTYCGTFYEARLGDFCNLIIMKFGISLDDFVFLNPAINENCTNLFAEESYCVQPVGDINTYSGKPGYGAPTLTMTGTIDDTATTLPDASFTYPLPVRTPLPLASGTRKECYQYADGDEWQVNITSTYFSSQCEFFAAVMGVTLEDLQVWNPSLGDTTDPSCSFESGVRYCGKYYYGDREAGDDNGDPGLPGREGMTEDCTMTVNVRPDGLPTCQSILDEWELSNQEFYEMNPSVGVDCSGMWAGYHYCVRTSDWVPPTDPEPSPTTSFPTTTPSPTTPPTSVPTAPGPVQDGQPENCNVWHIVAAGDDCSIITAAYDITFAQFVEWNPAVSNDCLSGFWGGYAYCVGVSSGGGGEPIPAPEPNQAGNAISTCNEYAQAQDGDWCAAFADRHGLDYANFYSWNSALGGNGANCGGSFWAGYWYCIGVAA